VGGGFEKRSLAMDRSIGFVSVSTTLILVALLIIEIMISCDSNKLKEQLYLFYGKKERKTMIN
jgi:hypothetical protein